MHVVVERGPVATQPIFLALIPTAGAGSQSSVGSADDDGTADEAAVAHDIAADLSHGGSADESVNTTNSMAMPMDSISQYHSNFTSGNAADGSVTSSQLSHADLP
ncbi:hypothetical protein B7463_g12767, partial [Scytalidium lignicola]